MKPTTPNKVTHLIKKMLQRLERRNTGKMLPAYVHIRNGRFFLFFMAAILCASVSFAQTTYYYAGSGRLDRTSSWGTNTDGSGSNPSNFTSSNRIYEIRNCTSVELSRSWTVSGSNSKVVLGNSSLPAITLSHTGGDFEADLDISSASTGSNTYTITTSRESRIADMGTLSTGSTVEYLKNGDQDILGETYYNLVLSNGGTKTADDDFTVNGTLTIESGVELDMETKALSGSFTTSGTGDLITSKTSSAFTTNRTYTFTVYYNSSSSQNIIAGNYQNLNGTGGNRTLPTSGTVAVAGTFTKGSGSYTVTSSTVSFNGTTQTIPAITFNNLTIEGSATKTASTNTTVNGVLTINSGTELSMSTFTLAGISSTSGTGTLTTNNTSATPVPTGETWAFTVNYSSSSSQNIMAGNYASLNTTGGNRVLPNGGTVKIAGTFTPGAGTFTTTGSTVEFNGSVAQSIPSGFTYNNLTLNNGSGASLSADIIVSSTLSFLSGSLSLNDHSLTLNGDLTGTTSFTGSASSHLSIGGTGSVTSSLNMTQSSSTTRTLNTFTFSRTAGTLTLGNALEVTGTVTVSNGTITSGGNLTIVSNASGTGRVAAFTGTGDISGDVNVQRYVPALTRRYRYICPPTSSFTYAQLIDDMFITGTGAASNGFDAGISSSTIYTLQESTTGGRGWKAAPAITTSVSAGTGFICYVRGDRTLASPDWYVRNNSAYPATGGFPAQNEVNLDFTGPLNKGNISPTITYTNTSDPTADGWNLIGNPYASQIDWSLVTKSNLTSFVYLFDPATNAYVANDGSVPIASSQAFMVQANAASPSVTFTESCKIASAPTSYFKAAAIPNRFTIRMVLDSLNSDVAWLRIRNGASMGFDASEDATKFSNAVINMGFRVPPTPTNVQLNTVPPLTNIADTFVLYANAAANTYTMEFSQLQNIPETKSILLRDLFTSTNFDVRASQVYTFTITSNPASQGNRFQLIIINNNALPVELTKFTATRMLNNKDVEIKWSTSSEVNSGKFIVERSINNASQFQEINSLNAAGNSNTNRDYDMVDMGILEQITTNAVIYYRLKEVDFDGKEFYSEIVPVEVNKYKVSDISVFPNPVSENLYLKTNIPLARDLNYEIYDLSGRLVQSGQAREEGIYVSHLMSAIYIVRFTGEAVANPVSLKFTKVAVRGKKGITPAKINPLVIGEQDIDIIVK